MLHFFTKNARLAVAFVCGILVTISLYQIDTCDDSLIDWSKVSADSMTGRQITEYFKWTNPNQPCQTSRSFGGKYFFPLGFDGQKELCLDKQVAPVSERCIVYSFGINNEWSFDDAMEEYGCSVFAFDPSMGVVDHLRNKRTRFYNMGLAAEDVVRNNWKMRTLASVYKRLQLQHGDLIVDYLKIDIEGDEWKVIENIVASKMLPKIRQMGVEIHMWPVNGTIDHYRNLVKIIQLLEANGMVRFSSAVNTATYQYIDAFGFKDYNCYEIAWYNSYHYGSSTNL